MTVLVMEKQISNNNSNNDRQSKEIICQKCGENCRIKIHNYKLKLFGCKNGHEIDNILLNEFDNTQLINESKIICNNYNKINKSISYNRLFFKCLTCGQNLCPLCNKTHNKSHNIIDYDKKYYICNIHNDLYISYCEQCKTNLCFQCEEQHNNHNIISYRKIFPNINETKEEMEKFTTLIENLKNNIKQIITILNNTLFCIEKYYNINYNIINNFEIQNKNYQVLQNINEVKNNIKMNIFNNILNENNIGYKFEKIFHIYNQMITKDNINIEDDNLNKLNNELKDKNNNKKNENKNEFDPSLYEEKGYTIDEILEMKEAFDSFDTKKNGQINANELMKTLKDMDKNNLTAQNMICEIKKQNLEIITFDKFIDMMKVKSNNSYDYDFWKKKFYEILGDDKDDKLTFNKFSNFVKKVDESLSEETIREMFLSADKNNDGKLSWEEFSKAIFRK